jgi:16S rRNA processing protein RimM
VVVGRIGRPHGVLGEVTVEVRTDDPGARFAPGSVLLTEPAARGPLTVAGSRWHRQILLLAFDGVATREDAEALRNTELLIGVADLPPLEEPDVFYDHQLVGLTARLPDGSVLGEVTAVRHDGADLLVIARPDGDDALVPFVSAIVPTVEPEAGYLVVAPPEGLLEL